VVIVTNQGGIGRGYMTEADLAAIHARMLAALEATGGKVEAVVHCPHAPADACPCRKPKPGMLQRAAAEHGLDLARSVFVGDHLTDVQAARAAGCRPVLVLTGRGRAARATAAADPQLAGVVVLDDLPAAVDYLLDGGMPALPQTPAPAPLPAPASAPPAPRAPTASASP
jgi:D-glycero-D-manno-heptose 1,7-bisphosphate phosphatase